MAVAVVARRIVASAGLIFFGASALGTSSLKKPVPIERATFEEYVAAHGRKYSRGSAEYAQRQSIFNERLALVEAQNSREERLWTAGVNGLTDRTEEELAQLRGWRPRGGAARDQRAGLSLVGGAGFSRGSSGDDEETGAALAATVDWRNLLMSFYVPDQGACGSCWAVATAGLLEARHEAQLHKSRTFSAQQLVNCVPNPKECGGAGGCSGATVELALMYVDYVGLAEELAAPYAAAVQNCTVPVPEAAVASFSDPLTESQLFSSGVAARAGMPRSWVTLPKNKALPLMIALAEGPVAVAVSAAGWSLYHAGVFDGCAGNEVVVDHAVLLFGYGQEGGTSYWIVRNSWGGLWGESGYIRLLRQDTWQDEEARCAINRDPGMGLACKPYPESVEVCGMCGILYDSVVAHFGDGDNSAWLNMSAEVW